MRRRDMEMELVTLDQIHDEAVYISFRLNAVCLEDPVNRNTYILLNVSLTHILHTRTHTYTGHA